MDWTYMKSREIEAGMRVLIAGEYHNVEHVEHIGEIVAIEVEGCWTVHFDADNDAIVKLSESQYVERREMRAAEILARETHAAERGGYEHNALLLRSIAAQNKRDGAWTAKLYTHYLAQLNMRRAESEMYRAQGVCERAQRQLYEDAIADYDYWAGDNPSHPLTVMRQIEVELAREAWRYAATDPVLDNVIKRNPPHPLAYDQTGIYR